MKVLLVTRQMLEKRDGSVFCDSALLPTIRKFQTLGDLYICACQYEGNWAMPIDSQIDISVNQVDFLKNESSLKNRYLDRSHNRQLLDRRVQEADLVIGYVPGTVCDLALDIAKKYGKKYLSFVVACIWDSTWNHASWKARVMAPIFFLETRRTIRHSDYVWYVTEEFLQRRYPTKGYSLGCTDTSIAELDDACLERRLKKIDETEHLKLLTVGHLDVGFKGQQYVIKALPQLPGVDYYMIGGGTGEGLQRLAQRLGVSDRIHFLGKMNRREVLRYMDEMDVYLQVSLQEGLPRAVAEAMSRAMPVIGSQTGGMPEMLDEAYVTRRRSVADIVNILRQLTKDEMKAQARRNFEKARDYQPSTVEKKISAFFNEISGRYCPGS